MKFRTFSTRTLPTGEKFTQPSETIPDESLTVRQIYDRFAKGQPLNIGNRSEIYEDVDYEDAVHPGETDLVDIIENQQRIEQLEVDFKGLQRRARKAKAAPSSDAATDYSETEKPPIENIVDNQ